MVASNAFIHSLDVAEVVMNRCIKTNSRKNVKAEKQVTPSHPEYRVTFNYEFLEDYKEPGQAQAKSSARYKILTSPTRDICKGKVWCV